MAVTREIAQRQMAEPAKGPEQIAAAEFEQALHDMDRAAHRMIAAIVRLRETRAGASAKYKY